MSYVMIVILLGYNTTATTTVEFRGLKACEAAKAKFLAEENGLPYREATCVWNGKPNVGRVAHGVPARMDRNDLDGEVVNVFRMLQSQALELKRLLEVTPFARDEFELSMVPVEDPLERARRTIMRSFMGFGSDSVTRLCRTGFRTNSNRSGTTPAHDWASWPNEVNAFQARLSGVVIENRDAREVMTSQDGPDTLHYVDPPYLPATRSAMQKDHGYRHELDVDGHVQLLAFLKDLKGMVILSGYPDPLYDTLGWHVEKMMASTFKNGNLGSKRVECLWLNTRAANSRTQTSLELSKEIS